MKKLVAGQDNERRGIGARRLERGSVNGTAVFFLALLSILAVTVSSFSTSEVLISRNEAVRKRDFYIAEGGVHREAREIGSGHYDVDDINSTQVVATEKTTDLPLPAPHRVLGEPYDFTVTYAGVFQPTKGFSAKHFQRHDYEIQVTHGTCLIKARFARIGPKTE
ncbi:MAG: hypothetical protein ACOZF0_20175 [Thermodesulfobacteriota bacterium]